MSKLTYKKLEKMFKSIKDYSTDSTWLVDGKIYNSIEIVKYFNKKFPKGK